MLHYGRRKAIALDSLFYTVGPLLMALALHPSMLIVGRFLTGLGIGISAVVAPAYLGVHPSRMPCAHCLRPMVRLMPPCSSCAVRHLIPGSTEPSLPGAYSGEIAPARIRGRVVESYEIMLCVGMLASVLVDAGLQHLADGNWRWMVCAQPGMPVRMQYPDTLLPTCSRHAVFSGM